MDLLEPLKLLQDALQDPRLGIKLPKDLRGHDVLTPRLLTFMRDKGLRALLLLDEAELLYLRDDERHNRVWRQLHSIGEYAGPRPVMAVLTGSAAVLRAMLFAIPGCGGTDMYKGYLRFPSLNDRKYMAITLRPIVATADVRRAILCISSNNTACVEALQCEGHLVRPSGDGACSESAAGAVGVQSAASPARGAAVGGAGCANPSSMRSNFNVLAEGYSVFDEFALWVCARCRGLASWIHDTLMERSSRMVQLYHVERLLGDRRDREHRLRRLLNAWTEHTREDAAVAAAAIYDERICDFGMRLEIGEPTAPWLELMDCGAAFVNESAAGFTVHFLHPSDAGTLLLCFRKDDESPEGLTLVEQLSLLQPHLASADEINEQLVFESIAWKASAERGGLTLLDDTVLTGVRKGTRHLVLSDAEGRPTTVELLHPANSGVLSKEFPDMRGSDGCAYIPQVLTGLSKHILMRVQVKLAGLSSSTCFDGPTAIKWVDKVVASSNELVKLISGERGASETVVARHVFWVAQQMTGPVKGALSDASRVALLVHSENMLGFWAPRIRRFVEQHRLEQYGYAPDPTTGGQHRGGLDVACSTTR
jgi:hypothetical protein